MKWSKGSVLFKHILYGADTRCKKGPAEGVANSCGIHFHKGRSCAEAGLVGGHYWNSAELATDPWTFGAYYTSSRGYVKVNYGAGSGSTTGRVFVLHDRDGKRISCDVVAADTQRTVEQRIAEGADSETVEVPTWVVGLWDVPQDELNGAGALFPSLVAMVLASAFAFF
jgi:hypothetical protein